MKLLIVLEDNRKVLMDYIIPHHAQQFQNINMIDSPAHFGLVFISSYLCHNLKQYKRNKSFYRTG